MHTMTLTTKTRSIRQEPPRDKMEYHQLPELQREDDTFDLLMDVGVEEKDDSFQTAKSLPSLPWARIQRLPSMGLPSLSHPTLSASLPPHLLANTPDRTPKEKTVGQRRKPSKRKRLFTPRKKSKRTKTGAPKHCSEANSLDNVEVGGQTGRIKFPLDPFRQNESNNQEPEPTYVLPVSSFCYNEETERNVQIDSSTNRGYVYTTDMTGMGLPEFLFLDVPNDPFAVSLCGRWITNSLLQNLAHDVEQIPGRKRAIIKSCNLQLYQQDVFHPLTPDGSVGETITVKFRLRTANVGTHFHTMLAQNFFGGRSCSKGIVVFLPCIKPKSPFHAFWGNSPKVALFPEHDENVTMGRTDHFCKDFASHYGQHFGEYYKTVDSGKESHAVIAARNPNLVSF
jgi:hypothetical protein